MRTLYSESGPVLELAVFSSFRLGGGVCSGGFCSAGWPLVAAFELRRDLRFVSFFTPAIDARVSQSAEQYLPFL